jgi:hypothetical protein
MTEEPREDRRQQPKPKKEQLLSPATAAQKLGVFLPATPDEFRAGPISRNTLHEWLDSPPEWLTTLRRGGPHPRGEVARRLGVSNSALTRGGVSDSLTTAEIRAIIDEMPQWLVDEREKHAPGTGRKPGTAVGERPAFTSVDRADNRDDDQDDNRDDDQNDRVTPHPS